MTTAAAFIFGLAAGFLGYAWISAPERNRQRARTALVLSAAQAARRERDELDDRLAEVERAHLKALIRSVCAEAELRGQENPLPGVEPTPIADGLCFERWADELGGAS